MCLGVRLAAQPGASGALVMPSIITNHLMVLIVPQAGCPDASDCWTAEQASCREHDHAHLLWWQQEKICPAAQPGARGGRSSSPLSFILSRQHSPIPLPVPDHCQPSSTPWLIVIYRYDFQNNKNLKK